MIGHDDGLLNIFIDEDYSVYEITNPNIFLNPVETLSKHKGKIISINHIVNNNNIYIITSSTDDSLRFIKMTLEDNIYKFEEKRIVYVGSNIKDTDIYNEVFYFGLDNDIYKIDLLDELLEGDIEIFIEMTDPKYNKYFKRMDNKYERVEVDRFVIDSVDMKINSYSNDNNMINYWDINENSLLMKENNLVEKKEEKRNNIYDLHKGEELDNNRYISIITEYGVYYENIDKFVPKINIGKK